MATGIIGYLAGAGSVTYNAQVNAKMLLTSFIGSSGTITVNGVTIASGSTIGNLMQEIFVGAGQSVTVATNATAYCIVSVLESA